jgi:molybdopterin converting factor small subunit
LPLMGQGGTGLSPAGPTTYDGSVRGTVPVRPLPEATRMDVTVEFFGIPRQRAGVAETTSRSGRLGDVLADLERRFPGLTEDCLADGRLRPACVANLNGEAFVSDPATILSPGDALLILSADAGG